MATIQTNTGMIKAGAVEIEVSIRGEGPPLLLLYSEEQLEADLPLIDTLAQTYKIIMPSAPGFGRSPRPDWMTNPEDIAYVYLDLLTALDARQSIVVGFSLGGWIAAEMATKDTRCISKLALVDPYGVKIGGPFDVDIADMWILHPDKVAALKWRDIEKGKRDFSAMSDEELTIIAQNIETFARFCWEPYMHNPKLKHRLHRIDVPTLVVWGENDGLTKPSYGHAYASMIPGARFETIANAGHFPHIEQPEAFERALKAFLA